MKNTLPLLMKRNAIVLISFFPVVVTFGCGSGGAVLSASSSLSATSDSLDDGNGTSAGSGGVKVIVEPSDDGAALVAAITAAKTSVHMTMYELSATSIIDALTGRAAAGVEVKVILDSSSTTSSLNKKSFSTLQSAGVSVVWSSTKFTYTHEKCVVLDGATAWIMTMNSATSSLTQNREYLGVDTIPADVAEAEAQFTADFAGVAYTPTGALLMSPVTSRPGLENLIASATATLDFEVEEFSDPTLATDMCAATKRGVKVRGCLAATTLSSTEQAAATQLEGCGVTLVSLSVPYIHAKAIVVDGKTVFIGSENFSPTSLDDNRELGLITEDATFVSTVEQTLSGDIMSGTAL